MRRMVLAATVTLIGAALLTLTRRADAQEKCNVDVRGRSVTLNGGTPAEQSFLGGGVTFTCPSGKVIKADSAVVVQGSQQTFLIGHAYYSDQEKALSGDRIYYWGREQHLTSQGGPTHQGVILTDKVNGAVITGEFLDYYQPKAGQESRAIMYGGKPHAVLRGKPKPGAPPADTAATLVDADRFEVQGQKTFHAISNVVLTRGELHGTAQEMFYNPDAESLKLSGSAKVVGQDMTLTGGTIDGTLAGNQFKDVTATFQAALDAKDLRVRAPLITIALDSGQVRSLIALSAERAKRTATDGKVMAEAVAKDFRLTADSIDALAPNQKVERVVAVGRAYGERQNDSIKVKMPEIAAKDWLRGDTITGYFADAPPKASPATGARNGNGSGARNGRQAQPAPASNAARPAGSAAPADSVERVLERIVAVGDEPPASSMYRIVDDKKPKDAPAISYLLARRITVAFKDGQVREVSATGEIRGIHLQPQEPKKAKTTDKSVAQTPAAPAAAGSPRR